MRKLYLHAPPHIPPGSAPVIEYLTNYDYWYLEVFTAVLSSVVHKAKGRGGL